MRWFAIYVAPCAEERVTERLVKIERIEAFCPFQSVRRAEHPTQRLEELLPWRWAVLTRVDQAA